MRPANPPTRNFNPFMPSSVSSDFGQLAVRRHLTSGMDWAMAGAASADAVTPAPAALRNSRRFIWSSLVVLPVDAAAPHLPALDCSPRTNPRRIGARND